MSMQSSMKLSAWSDMMQALSWRDWRVLAGVGAIAVLMVTVDGPLSSMMRGIDGDARRIIDILASSGNSKYSLVPTGVAAIVLMALYFLDASTRRARFYAWLAGASGFIFASIAVSGIATNVVKILLGRARPNVVDDLSWPLFQPIATSGDFHSFPSGHGNTIFCIAIAVGFFAPRLRIPLLIVAAVLAFGRVLQFKHFVSDTAGGALLAAITTIWLRQLFARWSIVFRKLPSGRIGFTAPGRVLLNGTWVQADR